MSESQVAYRSNHPDVLAAWQEWKKAIVRFDEQVATVVAELWPDPVPFRDETHQPVAVIQHGGTFDHGAQRLVGFSWPYSLPVPEGWKPGYSSDGTMITPKVSTKIGKAIRKRMDQVARVRGLIFPGMPPLDMSRMPHVYTHSAEEHGGYIYVTWSVEPREPIDIDVWQTIKLSGYHLARETDLDD